jgi:hypothetical protein
LHPQLPRSSCSGSAHDSGPQALSSIPGELKAK